MNNLISMGFDFHTSATFQGVSSSKRKSQVKS